MLHPNTPDIVALIMAGAVHTALHDPTTDPDLAKWLATGIKEYIGDLPAAARQDIRLTAIAFRASRTPGVIINREADLSAVEVRSLIEMMGRQFSAPLMRKIGHAARISTIAGRKRMFLGIIDVVDRRTVVLKELPWTWGIKDWRWKIPDQFSGSLERDDFLISVDKD